MIYRAILLTFLFPMVARAEAPKRILLDNPIFKTTIDSEIKIARPASVPDAKTLNSLISEPCFRYNMPYCMPTAKTAGSKGFVCSGQSAVITTYLASLAIPARPFYLEWQTATGETEAHAMVLVPYRQGELLCHHFLEVARTWPRQPIVEFSQCHPKGTVSGAALVTSLENLAKAHFYNPPAHTKEREAEGQPSRIALAKEKEGKFKAREMNVPYSLSNPYNPKTPIWTLNKENRWDCPGGPGGFCIEHNVASNIVIDQRKIDMSAPDSFKKTEIIVDYKDSPVFDCTAVCQKERCEVRVSNNPERYVPAQVNLTVNWPPARAACAAAAPFRANFNYPFATCKSHCETPRLREGYLGGRYTGSEPRLRCTSEGLIHVVRRPEDFNGVLPPDGHTLPRDARFR